MSEITDEACAIEEKWAKINTNAVNKNHDLFSDKNTTRFIAVDSFSADYLISKANADHITPAEIIRDMVQEKMTVSVLSK
jgi:hypothetical protein